MKITYLILTAGIAMTGALWSNYAGANSVGGGFWRTSPSGPAQGTGCATAVDGSKDVDFDSNLNLWGANINVAPFTGCTRVEDSHLTDLTTHCYSGASFNDSDSGGTGQASAADILRLCDSGAGGGEISYFNLSN